MKKSEIKALREISEAGEAGIWTANIATKELNGLVRKSLISLAGEGHHAKCFITTLGTQMLNTIKNEN